MLTDSQDKKTRWIELRIPVNEGQRYRVASFDVAGNTIVKSEFLIPLFKTQPGDYFAEKNVRKGLDKARETYGTGGYMEFTGYPDFKFSDDPIPNEQPAPSSLAAVDHEDVKAAGPHTVNVTMRLQEGQQFFVDRITFVGNTTTHDNVIRREMRLVEGAPFNTEALKFSVKRLNQLGYFKALEGKPGEVDVQKIPDSVPPKVDVKLKLEEQNRNSLTFGLFDRNITGGAQVFRTDVRYISQFTQQSTGGVLTMGFPIGRGFTRMFVNYNYQRVRVTEINELYQDPVVLARNPFLRDSLLIGQDGERIVSKVVPSIVYNTVDQPIFPTTGKRFTGSIDLAGLGGNTNFFKPLVEGVWFVKQASHLTLGMRAQYEYIHAFSGTRELPIFEKLFQGGEYSVRGFDIRSIGPQDPTTGLVLGGNKSVLFNVEEQITIAGPVRAILFYDAGQVQSGPTIQGPPAFVPDGGSLASTLAPGQDFHWRDFKTSTGVEVRFFMPVLNVPFRLIFAYNPQRDGVLDNTLQPQSKFQFRFAVGSTF